MSGIEIGFEWPVAAGYQIVNHPEKSIGKKRKATLIDGRPRGPVITPKRGRKDIKRPLEIRPLLFMDFAHLDGSPENCLVFAERWGLLGLDPLSDTDGEALVRWQAAIRNFREAVAAWQSNSLRLTSTFQPIMKLTAGVVEMAGGGYSLELRPGSLIGAMKLQFANAIATNKIIKACGWCGSWFGAGPGAARRADARFCSDVCRTVSNNARKAQAAKALRSQEGTRQ